MAKRFMLFVIILSTQRHHKDNQQHQYCPHQSDINNRHSHNAHRRHCSNRHFWSRIHRHHHRIPTIGLNTRRHHPRPWTADNADSANSNAGRPTGNVPGLRTTRLKVRAMGRVQSSSDLPRSTWQRTESGYHHCWPYHRWCRRRQWLRRTRICHAADQLATLQCWTSCGPRHEWHFHCTSCSECPACLTGCLQWDQRTSIEDSASGERNPGISR